MSTNQGVLVIAEDTILKGEVRNCRQLDVRGYVEGTISAKSLNVHQGGRAYGTIRVEQADVHGEMQGRVAVRELIHIRATGKVNGTVNYGRMAMDAGGQLSAEVRNVPPSLAGDFELSVAKGSAVRINAEDLHAVDPDDDAGSLTFTVSNPRNGFVAAADAPNAPLLHFTQADLDGGRVLFRHDGTASASASFDVVVADHTGASSGRAQTVHVTVRG